MWVVYSLLTVLFWGSSDVVFKSVAHESANSAAELLSVNGIVLGACGVIYALLFRVQITLAAALIYLPVAAAYLISMVCYYSGIPLIKLSILSPVGNCSCGLVVLLCFFVLKQPLTLYQAVTVAIMVTCMALLSQNRERDSEQKRTYPLGIMFALGYFLLDGIGSFLDDYTIGAKLTADEVFVIYAMIYGVLGLLCYLHLKQKQPRRKSFTHRRRVFGALLETAGQFTYVYAFAHGDAVLASPFIASFSAVSVLLSRILLNERLDRKQYILVAIILSGMVLLAL